MPEQGNGAMAQLDPAPLISLVPEKVTSQSDQLDATLIPPWPEAVAQAARSRSDKRKLFHSEVQRLRDPGHLRNVRNVASLFCLVCGRKPTHAHHLRLTAKGTRS